MISAKEIVAPEQGQIYCNGCLCQGHYFRANSHIEVRDTAVGFTGWYCKECAFKLAEQLVSITKYQAFL